MRLLFAWRPRTTRSSGNWRLLPPTVSDRRRYVVSIQGQQIEVNDLTLNVYVEGESEPVMLLHGFPDS